MCGICGVAYSDIVVNSNRLYQAINTFHSRGPDFQNIWTDQNIGLGHARLAIIDLDVRANQPFVSNCGRYVIVYNGEIYNFKEIKDSLNTDTWHTKSDTEVLLNSFIEWGESCVERFNGMFAFAIYDKLNGSFFCARDKLGKKPFYYSFVNGNFVFASRPSAILELINIDKDIDQQALRLYLEAGYIPAELSIYKYIKKLEPATTLSLVNNKIILNKYWDFKNIEVDNSLLERKEDDLIDELDELLTSAVEYRMVSDVKLGSFLSGGIDSSLVTSIMAKISNEKIDTFSIGFHETKWDESPFARDVAKYLNTNHHTEILDMESMIDLIPLFMKNFDEPFFDSSAFPTMAVSRLAKKHVTVALTGDGADEIFGGYHYYLIMEKLKIFYTFPQLIRELLSKFLYIIPHHQLKLLSQAIVQKDLSWAYSFTRSIIKNFTSVLDNNLKKDTFSMGELFEKTTLEMPKNIDIIEYALRLDTAYIMPDNYLQKVDISSMAFSLETRSPFLDYRVVEWAAKLPIDLKVKNGINKYLLRKLAYRYIPKEIIDRPKRGFSVPISKWIRQDLKESYLTLLNKQNSDNINIGKVKEIYNIHLEAKRDIHPLLWAIYVYMLWEENR